MKNMKYIYPIIAVLGLVACDPLAKMGDELNGQKDGLAELKTNKEDWDNFKEDLGEKRTALTTMSSKIKKLQTLIDSLEGGEEEDFPIVAAHVVELQKFESFVKVHGIVATDKNISVVPEGAGIIRKIMVRRGSNVRAGQVLAYLDSDILSKNLKELQASLAFANTLYLKQKSLYDQNVGTEVQYLEAKNRKESLENSIQTLKSQKAKSIITAPISGKIDEIFPNVGEMASQQVPFARIVNTNNVYVEADVSEAFVGEVNIGDSVFIKFPNSDIEIGAKISYKGNFINPNNRTFKVHAVMSKNKQQLVPNMLTVMKLRDVYSPKAIVVNNTAINTDFNGDYVFKLVKEGKNYKTVKTSITRGATYQNKTIIKSGLEGNDFLVTQRYQTLDDGDIVELKK